MDSKNEVSVIKNLMPQEEANRLISEKMEQIQKLIEECKELASNNGCYFEYQFLSEHEVQVIESKARRESRDYWESSSC